MFLVNKAQFHLLHHFGNGMYEMIEKFMGIKLVFKALHVQDLLNHGNNNYKLVGHTFEDAIHLNDDSMTQNTTTSCMMLDAMTITSSTSKFQMLQMFKQQHHQVRSFYMII
jgi:hypothetical protein